MRRSALLALLWAGCATTTPPPRSTIRDVSDAKSHAETGLGTWYGKQQHGGPTASGERFDMWALTAAHKHLPLGSRVRVTNLKNEKSVIVRINDRGPYGKGRIIDLSFAAAKALDMVDAGVVPVRVEVVR